MQSEWIVKNKLSKESVGVERMQIAGCGVWSRSADTKRANIRACEHVIRTTIPPAGVRR